MILTGRRSSHVFSMVLGILIYADCVPDFTKWLKIAHIFIKKWGTMCTYRYGCSAQKCEKGCPQWTIHYGYTEM